MPRISWLTFKRLRPNRNDRSNSHLYGEEASDRHVPSSLPTSLSPLSFLYFFQGITILERCTDSYWPLRWQLTHYRLKGSSALQHWYEYSIILHQQEDQHGLNLTRNKKRSGVVCLPTTWYQGIILAVGLVDMLMSSASMRWLSRLLIRSYFPLRIRNMP